MFEDSKILKIQFPEPESSVTQKCSLLNSHTCVNGKPILEDNIKVTITFEVHTKILEYNIMPFIFKAKIENLSLLTKCTHEFSRRSAESCVTLTCPRLSLHIVGTMEHAGLQKNERGLR